MNVFEILRSVLWGWPVLLLILVTGVYVTVFSRFYQFRCWKSWLLLLRKEKTLKALAAGGEDEAQKETQSRQISVRVSGGDQDRVGESVWQALMTALGGSIGAGNILGVAVAISTGGPGALFWMWVSALFGMMTVYAENSLAARYKDAPGPLGYLRKAGRWGGTLAELYAFGCVFASLGMGNMAQSNACADALKSFGVPPAVTGVLLAILLFFVARNGLSFAVKITEKLVPAMSLLYFAAAFGVLWIFRENLPTAFDSIFREAFSLKAGAGGTAGAFLAMKTGISRGVFTNEAGLGSSAFAYEGVEGKSPEELGCLGIFQVFLDTIVMCTVTGLCILCCRSPILEGAPLTFFAFEAALGRPGSAAVSLCTALFSIATVISWCCYGRAGFFYATSFSSPRPRNPITIYCGLAALAAFLGCVMPLGTVLDLCDAFNGLLALPNLFGLWFHRKELFAVE